MKAGTDAFKLTGTPLGHGEAIQLVVDRMRHGVLFRAVGAHCTKLLEENYAAKGFRIDTKSCDWGPMRGFVCVDPRLSKSGLSKEAANRHYTSEALRGEVRHDAIGGLDVGTGADGKKIYDTPAVKQEMALWAAGAKPIVISTERFNELVKGKHINIRAREGDHILGESVDPAGQVRVPWRLIPIAACKTSAAFNAAVGATPEKGGYGVFVDNRGSVRTSFVQKYPRGAQPVHVYGFDTIQGLTNPGTEHLGYRACVTGDYDLFGVWPPREQAATGVHNRPSAADFVASKAALRPITAPRSAHRNIGSVPETGWDARYVDAFRGHENAHHHQHFQLGNITRRLNLIKTQLNTSLQSVGRYKGGALIHHSDEVGNPSPGLVKTLEESMPMIAFLPGMPLAFGIENVADFQLLVRAGVTAGLTPDLRPEWRHFLA